jgi:hypothetical protein
MFGLLRIIQGWVKLKGDTDGTKIGNLQDRLKVEAKSSDEYNMFMQRQKNMMQLQVKILTELKVLNGIMAQIAGLDGDEIKEIGERE